MIASQNQLRYLWSRVGCKVLIGVWLGILAPWLQPSAAAAVSANLTWTASPAAAVTGYNIYYGVQSHQYTKVVSVANVTATTIPELLENTTYFFAAKAHDSAGNESAFSDEAAFAGVTTTPNRQLRLTTLPYTFTGNPLTYSLASGSPAGATIDPTSGIVSWTPGRSLASTTNYITVQISDTTDPTLSLFETLLVKVTDYLEFGMGTTAVAAGQTVALPLYVAASGSVTNVQFTINWPDSFPATPTLTLLPPFVSGTVQKQGANLFIQLQTAPNQPLTGSNQVATLNFQTSARQDSTIFRLAVSSATGIKPNAVRYDNVTAVVGEVVVIGAQPLLRPHADTGSGRKLTLFANPGTYQVQYATSLAQPMNWLPLTTYRQTSTIQTLAVDSASPVIFYRLQQL